MPSRNNLHELYTSDQLVTLGLKLYKQSKYGEALEALNGAEEGKNGGADLEILDIRAATYMRLEKSDAALADARRMLMLDKTHVPGYLRTGKILESMEKHEVAMKIYERGIVHGDRTHARYDALKKLHANLKQKLAPAAGVNLFDVLPVELLEMIFSYFAFEVVCRCLRVCQQWRQIITTWPRFWIHVDFSSASRKVTAKMLLRYIAYARNGVRSAVLKNMSLQADSLLSKLTGKCQTLEHLTVLSGGSLRKSLLDALERSSHLKTLVLSEKVPIGIEVLGQALRLCPGLSTIICHDVVSLLGSSLTHWDGVQDLKLKQWDISTSEAAQTLRLSRISPPASEVKCLSLSLSRGSLLAGFGALATRHPNLERLEISNATIVLAPDEYVPLPPTLRDLTLLETGLSQKAAVKKPANLRYLRKLIVRETGPGTACGELENILACDDESPHEPPSYIESLKLWIQFWGKHEILRLLAHPRLRTLQHVGLIDCRAVDDDVVGVIASSAKELRSLQLPFSRITGVGLKMLVESCPMLAMVDLDNCDSVSHDAVEWARGQGVSVSLKINTGR